MAGVMQLDESLLMLRVRTVLANIEQSRPQIQLCQELQDDTKLTLLDVNSSLINVFHYSDLTLVYNWLLPREKQVISGINNKRVSSAA